MDIRFAPHNLHLESPDHFTSQDPHLKVLSRQALMWDFPLIRRLPVKTPGIYTVSGGRQVGKTTLLKQWMADQVDFQVFPLGFNDVVTLSRALTAEEREALMTPVPQVNAEVMARLFAAHEISCCILCAVLAQEKESEGDSGCGQPVRGDHAAVAGLCPQAGGSAGGDGPERDGGGHAPDTASSDRGGH